MRKVWIVIIILFSAEILFSQTDEKPNTSNWKKGVVTSLNFSQVSFSNWAAGGEQSITGNAFLNVFANYKKDKTSWDNTLDLGYGLMRQGTKKTSVSFYKTDDKIDFASKYGRYAFKYWYYSALVGFKTQFTDGYKSITDQTRISSFLAPAYLNISLGMDFKPCDKFSMFISPVTGKVTFVEDSTLSAIGAFGVDPGQQVRPEFGGYIKIQYKTDFWKIFTYTTKLDLFSNYLENPQNVDMNWENMLTIKFSNWFAANISLTMLYDDDVDIPVDKDGDGIMESKSKRLQLKQLVGFGITYKF